jgi:hypothetical protein
MIVYNPAMKSGGDLTGPWRTYPVYVTFHSVGMAANVVAS